MDTSAQWKVWSAVMDRVARLVTPAFLASVGLLLTAGCGPEPSATAPSLPDTTVVLVNNQTISVATFQSELARRSHSSAGLLNSSNQAWGLLEDLIRFEVFYVQACRAGFLERPETQAAIKRLVVAQYRESLATNSVTPAQVSETDVDRYYRAHTNVYRTPEQIRAALIFLPLSAKATPERQAATRQRAEAVRAQALTTRDGEATFGNLAQANSAHQPTRYRGGDLGWLTREAAGQHWEATLTDALFGLSQVGQISPVLEGKDGFYLFKLIERKPASMLPLAEVEEAIAYRLAREQTARQEQELYAQLKAGVAIRTNFTTLARLMTNVPPTPKPPAVPFP